MFDWGQYTGNLKWLPERALYLTRHGSWSYGTSLPTSDMDIRGIAVAPIHYYLGISEVFEQAVQSQPVDLTIFDIRKFMHLAADANPNALEIIFTDPSDHLLVHPLMEKLFEARQAFISQKAKHTFSGYSRAQMKRINAHYRWLKNPMTAPPTRAEFDLPERTVIPADQLAAAQAAIQKQIDQWSWHEMEHLDPALRQAMQDEFSRRLLEITQWGEDQVDEKVWTAASRAVGFDTNFIHLLYLERRYTGRLREWQNYQTWVKTRNPARAELEAKFGYYCYSADTEFLTNNGWKRFDDITESDQLATVFVNNTDRPMEHKPHHLGIEYQSYTDKFSGLHTGPMYQITGDHLELLVTPNHRMLMRKRERVSGKSDDWELREVAHLPDTFEFLHTITAKEKTYGTSALFQGLPISEATYLRLMGWYLSDGCMAFSASGRPDDIRVSQKKGGRLYGSMVKFSRKYKHLGCSLYHYQRKPTEFRPYEITEAVLSVRHRDLTQKLVSDCGSTTSKRIPRWVYRLSKTSMATLFDAMSGGDGTIRNTAYKSTIYYTNLKNLADDVQELAVLCGWETSLWGPYENGMYHVHVHKNAEQTRVLVRSANVTKTQVQDQRIVCFTVPNGTLVVRRNGKVSFQGNSKHAMHLVRISRMCREILTDGVIRVRRPDAQELLEIRHGKWTYEELVAYSDKQDAELNELVKTSGLPKQPDRKKLDQVCQDIILGMG